MLKNKTKEQIQNEALWYLKEQLQISDLQNWELITETDNLFFDQTMKIVGEPDFAIINQMTLEAMVIINIAKINFDAFASKEEENKARILAQIVVDTCKRKVGVVPNKIRAYIFYADYMKIEVNLYSNSELLIALSANKICKLQNKQLVSVDKLTSFMTKNPFVLVSNSPDLENSKEGDTFF